MHRSGTSLLSRSLKIFGGHKGKEDRNLEHLSREEILAIAGNVKGHWEEEDFMHLNNAILSSVNKSWNSILPLTVMQYENLLQSKFFPQAVELVDKLFLNTNFVSLKEPRITKLLPFWKEVFNACNIKVSYLFAFRSPIYVAQSLERRDKSDILLSLYLWYSYNLFSLNVLINDKILFINYDSFLRETNNYLDKIEYFLDIQQNIKEKEMFLKDFIDKELNHSNEETDIINFYPSIIFDLYYALEENTDNNISFELIKFLEWFEKNTIICRHCDEDRYKKLELNMMKSYSIPKYLNFTYFRYRILCEITRGSKRKEYIRKKKRLKSLISNYLSGCQK